MELINLAGIALLALLTRKLVWCLRWLWCSFLPRRTGETFEERSRQAREQNEEDS